jgi:hypothetical protein
MTFKEAYEHDKHLDEIGSDEPRILFTITITK